MTATTRQAGKKDKAADLMLLVKAVVTIEGVGRQIDPSFKIVSTPGLGLADDRREVDVLTAAFLGFGLAIGVLRSGGL